MGTLSIIIGVIVFLTALFPNLGYFILIPATVGLIVGICRLANEKENAWAISGVVLNGLAIFLALYWSVITAFSSVEVVNEVVYETQKAKPVQVIYKKPPVLNIKPVQHTDITHHLDYMSKMTEPK